MRIRANRAVLYAVTLALTGILNWTVVPALSREAAGVDPMLAFSTYLGGSLSNYVSSIAVDSMGATYVVGGTNSSDFPTTPGAFQPSYRGTDAANGGDAFIAKLSPSGS